MSSLFVLPTLTVSKLPLVSANVDAKSIWLCLPWFPPSWYLLVPCCLHCMAITKLISACANDCKTSLLTHLKLFHQIRTEIQTKFLGTHVTQMTLDWTPHQWVPCLLVTNLHHRMAPCTARYANGHYVYLLFFTPKGNPMPMGTMHQNFSLLQTSTMTHTPALFPPTLQFFKRDSCNDEWLYSVRLVRDSIRFAPSKRVDL